MRNATVLCNFEKGSTEERCLMCLYDTMGMMSALWWSDGMKILRRKAGSTTNEIQVLVSFQNAAGIIGTVIDENII